MKLTPEDISYILDEAVRLIGEEVNEGKKGVKHSKKNSKKKEKSKDDGESFDKEGSDINVHALQNKGLNLAQYAYRLYPDMDKATARSKFYKKIKHEKVTDGYSKKKTYKYGLSPEEAGKVSNMLTKPLAVKK